MARKLKIYGGMLFNKDNKQERVAMAVHNQKEIAQITGQSLYFIQGYWSETRNRAEIELALKTPLKIIWMGEF